MFRLLNVTFLGMLLFTGPCDERPKPPAPAPEPLPGPVVPDKDKEPPLVAAINAYRKTRGMPAYVYSPELQKAAQRHADDMARHRRLNHTGSDGSSFVRRAQDAGFSMRGGGEIIAQGDETEAVGMWKQSSGHHAQMLGNKKYIGAASAGGYSCAVFGDK